MVDDFPVAEVLPRYDGENIPQPENHPRLRHRWLKQAADRARGDRAVPW
jgi:hypothetical protein